MQEDDRLVAGHSDDADRFVVDLHDAARGEVGQQDGFSGFLHQGAVLTFRLLQVGALAGKEVARLLTTSVYTMLEKSITFSVPSAVQVLETLKGDCNEHTVLFVAMARVGFLVDPTYRRTAPCKSSACDSRESIWRGWPSRVDNNNSPATRWS